MLRETRRSVASSRVDGSLDQIAGSALIRQDHVNARELSDACDVELALRGVALDDLTRVNIDFHRMYRPQTNVVIRPVAGTSGAGISLVGHHEVLIPLLAAAIIDSE